LTIDDIFQTVPAADGSIYRITDTQFDMIISDQKIKEYVLDSAGEKQFYYFDTNAKIYVPIAESLLSALNDAHPFHGTAGWRFFSSVVKKNQLKIYFYHPFTSHHVLCVPNWTNPDHVYDWDNSTAAVNTYNGDGVPVSEYYIGRFIKDLYDILGNWDNLYLYYVAEHDMAADAIHVECFECKASNVYIAPAEANHSDTSCTINKINNVPKNILSEPSGFPAGSNVKLMELTSIDKGDWGTLNYNRWFWIQLLAVTDLGAMEEHDFTFHEAGLVFSKTVPINEQTKFYSYIKGRMYGGTWGRGKTSANLIENPADVTEKILRDDLGVTDIDTAAFDAANALRTGEKLAYSITKEINSLSEIQKIAQENMLAYWKRYDGKHTLRALELDPGTVKPINTSQVLIDENSKVSTFGVRMSDLDAVVNELYVHYDKDPATGDYSGLFFVKKPAEAAYDSTYTNLTDADEAAGYWALCHESYGKYGFTRTKHIYLDRVSSAATAELFIKRMIYWLFLRTADVTFKSQLELCDLEICDTVYLGSVHRDGNFMVSMVEEDLDLDVCSYKARELTDKPSHWKGKLVDDETGGNIVDDETGEDLTTG
jgi:hypothetical protein